MKHAYLIMAHNEVEILRLLLNKLDDKNNDIYIHLDKKFRIEPNSLLNCVRFSKIYFIKRKNIIWGRESQIWCELELLSESLKRKYDYYHLLTGVDLPIKTKEEIAIFFEEHKGKEFISYDGHANKTKNFTRRYDNWNFTISSPQKNIFVKVFWKFYNIIARIVGKILALGGKRSKKYPELEFMKGSSYFDITHEMAQYIDSQKSLIRRIFKFTSCCDEVFLHTFAYNSPLRKNITFFGTRFIDWSKHLAHPAILTMSHYEEIKNSQLLFARKFSKGQSSELVKQLFGVEL